ncbi:MAG: YfcC family protein [Bacteroidia bacterium]
MKFRIPHVFIFLAGIVLFTSLLTYVIPAGSFERSSRSSAGIKQVVIIPGSYQEIPKTYTAEGLLIGTKETDKAAPVSLLSILTAIPRGLGQSGNLIFFIFMIGVAFSLIFETGALLALLYMLIRRFENSPRRLFFIIYTVFSIASAFMGIHLELIPLIPVLVLLAQQTGYNRMFGVALAVLPAWIGWASGVTNPFNVQIAQQIAELPIGSGLVFRLILFVVCLIAGFSYLMWYGNRIQRNGLSEDEVWEPQPTENPAFSRRHIIILIAVVLCYAGILTAVQLLGWGLVEMSGGFMGMSILVIALARLNEQRTMDAIMKGLKMMLIPGLVVGIARGISVVMYEGQIIDTILNGAAEALSGVSGVMAAEGMLVFQTGLNFFIPSASGQALVSMPLMTPLADLLGLSRQTAVLAYVLGDGISNIIIPTNGALMAMLGVGKVSFEKWFRFAWPIFLVLMFIGAISLAIAVVTGY